MNVLLLLALLGASPEPPGRLCIAPADADFEKTATCSESPLRRIEVPPSTERRRYVWTSPAKQDLVMGIVLPGDSEVVLSSDRAGALQLQLEGAKNREWPVPATVTVREPNLGVWKFTLTAQQVVDPVTLQLPRGTYDVDVVAAGHRLFSKKAMTIGRIEIRPVVLHAVLVAQPRLTAAVFAKGERVPFARLHAGSRICESSADGGLVCDLTDDVPETVRIEHPRFGGRTIAIDRRMTDVDLGNVELRRGGTVLVERPPQVELPERTFAALLVAARDGRQIAAKRVDGERIVAFHDLDPGEYILLLRGPQPAQRKTFEVRVEEGTETRMALAIEPYKLTARVTFDREPFAGARVQLKERYWDARMETDADGRFESELWAMTDFAVLVSGGAVREPFGTMRRADVGDSDWTIEVPNRSLGGSVRDAATGKPLANVRVVIESDDGNVRQTRLLQTDDGGTFSLASVAAGTHEIRVQAEAITRPRAREPAWRTATASGRSTLRSQRRASSS